jgi:hypothetical protein
MSASRRRGRARGSRPTGARRGAREKSAGIAAARGAVRAHVRIASAHAPTPPPPRRQSTSESRTAQPGCAPTPCGARHEPLRATPFKVSQRPSRTRGGRGSAPGSVRGLSALFGIVGRTPEFSRGSRRHLEWGAAEGPSPAELPEVVRSLRSINVPNCGVETRALQGVIAKASSMDSERSRRRSATRIGGANGTFILRRLLTL